MRPNGGARSNQGGAGARPNGSRPQQRRSSPRVNTFEYASRHSNEPMSFEDMLSKFKQTSDDKMSDLKKVMDSKRGSGNGRRGSRS